ncbi:iron-containing redox enzyme family protein [Microbulbifer zhoushanensis]|uniref:iron-containing redox enzyme family protein n=1 Tax=Microbulbifer zhoushanensis TaxID=2904254 RepID=UPI001F2613FE|nr:iron-containing redox enzyme family protein [Microbulbifer zhoushanensis]
MNRTEFRDSLLRVMERKVHWSDPAVEHGQLPPDRLHILLEQEYATWVRDYGIFLGRAYAQCPLPKVRRELAESLYEEETGKISGSGPHAELFLEIPRGLGMNVDRFRHPQLLPQAAAYRAVLDEATGEKGWAVASAVTTLFLEGSRHERWVIEPGQEKPPVPRPHHHPLVKHYGLPVGCLALERAQRAVNSAHRKAAWHLMLDFVDERERPAVLTWMGHVLHAWIHYRDELAGQCGLVTGHVRAAG